MPTMHRAQCQLPREAQTQEIWSLSSNPQSLDLLLVGLFLLSLCSPVTALSNLSTSPVISGLHLGLQVTRRGYICHVCLRGLGTALALRGCWNSPSPQGNTAPGSWDHSQDSVHQTRPAVSGWGPLRCRPQLSPHSGWGNCSLFVGTAQGPGRLL